MDVMGFVFPFTSADAVAPVEMLDIDVETDAGTETDSWVETGIAGENLDPEG